MTDERPSISDDLIDELVTTAVGNIRLVPVEPQWQPIETAPKNIPPPGGNIATPRSDIILGWQGSSTVLMGYWHPGRGDDDEWDQSGTRGIWCNSDGTCAFTPPTHWQPLPDPPAITESTP